jgi:amino acid transporter
MNLRIFWAAGWQKMTSGIFDDVNGIDLGIGDDNTPVRAPHAVLVVALAALGVSLALFFPASRTLSIAGYMIGAAVVPLLVIVFRVVKRSRQRSTRYVEDPRWTVVPIVLLVLSIMAAIAHAFFYAKVEELIQ